MLLSGAESYSLTTDMWSSVNMTHVLECPHHYTRVETWVLMPADHLFSRKSHRRHSCWCTQRRTSGLATRWKKTCSYNHQQCCQYYCRNQVPELAMAQLFWTQFEFGCHKGSAGPKAKNGPGPETLPWKQRRLFTQLAKKERTTQEACGTGTSRTQPHNCKSPSIQSSLLRMAIRPTS